MKCNAPPEGTLSHSPPSAGCRSDVTLANNRLQPTTLDRVPWNTQKRIYHCFIRDSKAAVFSYTWPGALHGVGSCTPRSRDVAWRVLLSGQAKEPYSAGHTLGAAGGTVQP